MFYQPELGPAPLRHDPFKAIVAPRPIGWISAMSAKGEVNLAPYSYFNAISTRPHMVMFSSEGEKDAVTFIRETGEFVCSLATYALREEMNATSAPLPRGVSEFAATGLETAPSRLVKPPRVKASPAALECKLLWIKQMEDLDGVLTDRFLVTGQVVGIHVDESCLINGRFDMTAARTIARCGYADYAVVDDLFAIGRPAGAGGNFNS
jgi:flavin reductase (DIM6/NTAB) family NADH-FMN oxidoreductase RutF